MTINTSREAVEFALTLATKNRHITPAVRDLALALLERAETAEAEVIDAEQRGYANAMEAEREIFSAERDALQAEVARLRDGLRKCEAEIDQYIRQEYPGDHPIHDRYRKRDFAANPARIALEAKP
jgi:hypothetical protein